MCKTLRAEFGASELNSTEAIFKSVYGNFCYNCITVLSEIPVYGIPVNFWLNFTIKTPNLNHVIQFLKTIFNVKGYFWYFTVNAGHVTCHLIITTSFWLLRSNPDSVHVNLKLSPLYTHTTYSDNKMNFIFLNLEKADPRKIICKKIFSGFLFKDGCEVLFYIFSRLKLGSYGPKIFKKHASCEIDSMTI